MGLLGKTHEKDDPKDVLERWKKHAQYSPQFFPLPLLESKPRSEHLKLIVEVRAVLAGPLTFELDRHGGVLSALLATGGTLRGVMALL